VLLNFAATRDDHLILPPRLPIAAARQVARSLLGLELAEEVLASGKAADLAWPVGDGGGALVLRAAAVGLARIAVGAETTAAAVTTAHLADPGGGALLQGVAAHVWRPWAARLYRLSIRGRSWVVALRRSRWRSRSRRPTVAALTLSIAHWPWRFLVNVPLGLLAVPLFIAVAPMRAMRSPLNSRSDEEWRCW
jgi:hypothetical protein